MRWIICLSLLLGNSWTLMSQPEKSRQVRIIVHDSTSRPLSNCTVTLYLQDSTLYNSLSTDTSGIALFTKVPSGFYFAFVTRIDHKPQYSPTIDLNKNYNAESLIKLFPSGQLLNGVLVTARRPFIEFFPDKTVLNIDASVTNAGTSVLEVLEKSPGVTVDRDGNISLKGRAGVQVMIDGKLVQVSGQDLQNMLNGMSASEIESIELINNPSAKYDAAGNAGIINIKTKKGKQKGFNGTIGGSFGQGKYPKANANLLLNYRTGAFNFFLTYGYTKTTGFGNLNATRTYFNPDGSAKSFLDQPFSTRNFGYTHTLKMGMDYYLNKKTTLGFSVSGFYLSRNGEGHSTAQWSGIGRTVDSTINTTTESSSRFRQGIINLNAHHQFSANRELSVDVDIIGYRIKTAQYFNNQNESAGALPEESQGIIPSSINILSAKADYSHRWDEFLWETGLKSSRVSTDNLANYYTFDGNNRIPDLGKSNNFIYTENIQAAYTNLSKQTTKWEIQAGLRYEFTSYQARQLGNAVVKDSAFDRKYNSLFPSAFVTYHIDSFNSITIRGGRRIERPPFQKLNPFTFIINKYTYQQGNPYLVPQYTWNMEIGHNYKQILSTSFSYNITNKYFSQVFLTNSLNGTVIYTDGNVGKMQNFGLSMTLQLSPLSFWSLSAQAVANRKLIEGVLWKEYKASINQASINLNNQFKFRNGWSGEVSGFYITKNQNDLQEVLDPTGQVSFGFSKQVLKDKGTLRFSMRDIFYTQSMQGWSYFETSTEYFTFKRDSRVATISFNLRFGNNQKSAPRKTHSAAADEIDRVGGN